MGPRSPTAHRRPLLPLRLPRPSTGPPPISPGMPVPPEMPPRPSSSITRRRWPASSRSPRPASATRGPTCSRGRAPSRPQGPYPGLFVDPATRRSQWPRHHGLLDPDAAPVEVRERRRPESRAHGGLAGGRGRIDDRVHLHRRLVPERPQVDGAHPAGADDRHSKRRGHTGVGIGGWATGALKSDPTRYHAPG